MSTITKERIANLLQFNSGDSDCQANAEQWEVHELARIALASLEAEAVAWRYRHHNGLAPSNWRFVDSKDECNMAPNYQRQALYAAHPSPISVPDYPETLPCPVMLEPGLRFGKGVHTKTVLDALQRRAEYYADLEAMTPEQRAEHEAGMKKFAAMLQGADVTLINEGNIHPEDKLDMVDHSGGATEKVKSPVIPDGWKLVPIELTGDMTNAMSEAILDDLHNVDVWRSVLAAAPQQEVK